MRAFCALAVGFLAAFAAVSAAPARAEDRTLSFKQLHTGETVTITFKRNGRYDSEGLKKINYILRDWRRNEATSMDPALLDLVWEVRKATGSNAPVYILSGYRSPVTNAALRSRSRGVAQNSQHMVGKALDFYLPDVPLARLRETALKFQRGGVGYYPTSGSPFVHLDTGSVRHWPRMTRQQLAKLFPDGKTVLIPADGKPMPGYNEAVAEMKRGITTQMASITSSGSSRQQFVANYPRLDPSVAITEASVSRSTGTSPRSGRSLIAALFESGEDGDEEGASGTAAAAAPETPAPAAAEKPGTEPEPAAGQAPVVVAALSPAEAPVPRLKPAIAAAPVTPTPVAPTVVAAVPVPAPKPMVLASLAPAASEETSLTTASVPPATPVLAALPRERPLMAGADAIASLLAGGGTASAASSLAETPATALASTGSVADLAPFAATFTGPDVELRTGPVFVAIDYRPEAMNPYMDTSTCLRGATFVALRHPDQHDIGALTGISGPVVVNRFTRGPQVVYPMRKFTGPAVAPVSIRTYQMAALAAGALRGAPLDRATTLR